MDSRFKNLDLLRIIGCIAIIAFHLFCRTDGLLAFYDKLDIYKSLFAIFHKNYLVVELFFILSGLFFALKLDLKLSVWKFIKKKLIRLYPVMLFMLCIGWLGCVFGLYEFNLYDSILALFCLNGTGIVKTIGLPQSGINIFWYISAMLWVFLAFFYLLKNYERKTVNIIIAISIYISYVYLIRKSSMEFTSEYIDLFLNAGMCRAVGAIGIGYFIAQWYNSQKEFICKQSLNLCQSVLVTLVELLCMSFVIRNLFFADIAYNNDFIFVLVFALTVSLFLYKKGFISKILDRKIFSFLAKYTYSIFMVHFYIIYLLRVFFYEQHATFVVNHPILNIGLTYSIIFACGILLYYVVEQPVARYLKRNWN